jgi:hypothetical protein
MSKNKEGDRKIMENLLAVLPRDKQQYKTMAKLANSKQYATFDTFYNASAIGANILYSLPSLLTKSNYKDSFNSITAMARSSLSHIYDFPAEIINNGINPANIIDYISKFIVEDGNLFVQIASNKEYQDKIVNLVLGFVEELQEYEKDIDNLAKLNNSIDAIYQKSEISLSDREELDRKELDKEKLEKRISQYGSLNESLVDYKDLLEDIADETAIKAILSTPEYKFKIIKNAKQELSEDELGILVNDLGRLVIRSKLGKKEIELQIASENKNGISAETYFALTSATITKLDQRQIDELNGFIKLNDFPGVLQSATNKIKNFAINKSDQNLRELVDSSLELLTQKHVIEAIVPIAKQEIVDHIFELPAVTPKVKEYGPLVHSLAQAKHEEKFKHLFKTLLDQDPQLPNYISSLMKFITAPEYIKEEPNSPDSLEANETFIQANVDLMKAMNADVISAALPLVDEELIEHLFKLSKVKELLSEKDKLIKQAQNYIDKVQRDVIKASQKSLTSLDKITKFFTNKKVEILDDEINDETYHFFKTILNELKKEESLEINPSELKNNPVVKQLVQTIRDIASDDKQCKKLKESFSGNKETMATAVEQVIKHEVAGELLRGFALTGEQVADLLPKIMNKKGLEAVANYVEDPDSTYRLIMIFYETNTLVFAASHFVSSLVNISKKALNKVSEKIQSFFLKPEDSLKLEETKMKLSNLVQELPNSEKKGFVGKLDQERSKTKSGRSINNIL